MTASDLPSSSKRALDAGRHVLPVEEALRWTIRDELPKRRYDPPLVSMASGMNAIAVLGVRVDNWSREPGMPLAMGDPHPDALAIEQAMREIRVEDLDLSGYDIGSGLGPHCDLERVVANQVERFSGKDALYAQLVTHAIRNNRPDLGEGPMCEPGKGSRGQVTLWIREQEPIGTDAAGEPMYVSTDRTTTPLRAGVYRTGTFCKLNWIRNANDVAEDRAIYAIWHAALVRLAEILPETTTMEVDQNGNPIEVPLLRYIKVKPPLAPPMPWIADPTPPQARVLPAASIARTIGKPRVVAFVPREKREYPVRKIDPAEYAAEAA